MLELIPLELAAIVYAIYKFARSSKHLRKHKLESAFIHYEN